MPGRGRAPAPGALAGLALLLGAAVPAVAAPELVCDDLSAIPETPRVDFGREIVGGLFADARYLCSGCHGFEPLDLSAERAYEHLFCQPNQTSVAPAGLRVVPFSPAASWLFLRVNCDAPGNPSFRMPQFGGEGPTVVTSDQALLRDWIAQGARPSAEDLFATGFEANETCRAGTP